MTLGTDLLSGDDVAGWYWSEKLDGVRAYWDGAQLWTRSGRCVALPAELAACLPAFPVDGEIWAGRGNLPSAVAAANHGRWVPGIQFKGFDTPAVRGPWPKRLAHVAAHLPPGGWASAVEHGIVADMAHLARIFREVRAAGGEGLMLRYPRALYYQRCRTRHLLKVKVDPAPGLVGLARRVLAA